jgi:hypothetical protein
MVKILTKIDFLWKQRYKDKEPIFQENLYFLFLCLKIHAATVSCFKNINVLTARVSIAENWLRKTAVQESSVWFLAALFVMQ